MRSKDHLNLFPRDLGHCTVQARANLSIAEQEPSVLGNLHCVRSIAGMATNSIVERMRLQHFRIPLQRSDWDLGDLNISPESSQG